MNAVHQLDIANMDPHEIVEAVMGGVDVINADDATVIDALNRAKEIMESAGDIADSTISEALAHHINTDPNLNRRSAVVHAFQQTKTRGRGNVTPINSKMRPSADDLVLFPHVRGIDIPKPVNTRENLDALLKHHGYQVAFNAMNLDPMAYRDGRPLERSEAGIKSDLIGLAARSGLPKATIEDHLAVLAEQNPIHPVRDWIEAGQWDKRERLNAVIDCLNAKDNDLARLVMRKWMIGAVASLYEPTFSSKLVPVLQGEQSFMKTAYISRIACVVKGAFLEGAELNPDSKDSVLPAIKSWIVELGELERTSRNSQGSLKAFITKSVDTVRQPYGRSDTKKPRQTHFIASVNGTDFLRDDTGSSRYAVIEMERPASMDILNGLTGWEYHGNGSLELADPDQLRQLWLEVRELYLAGHSWNLTRDEMELIAPVNDQFRAVNGIEAAVRELFHGDSDRQTRELKASEVAVLLGLKTTDARQVGKALARVAQEGITTCRMLSGYNVYAVPVPQGWRP